MSTNLDLIERIEKIYTIGNIFSYKIQKVILLTIGKNFAHFLKHLTRKYTLYKNA